MMRPDRDSFVEILFDNIVPGQEGNFRRKVSGTYSSHDTPFDWGSIMMYGPTDAGKMDNATGTRMTTIYPKVPGVEIRWKSKLKWPWDEYLIRGPASKTELSLVDKIELARAYQNITSNSSLDISHPSWPSLLTVSTFWAFEFFKIWAFPLRSFSYHNF